MMKDILNYFVGAGKTARQHRSDRRYDRISKAAQQAARVQPADNVALALDTPIARIMQAVDYYLHCEIDCEYEREAPEVARRALMVIVDDELERAYAMTPSPVPFGLPDEEVGGFGNRFRNPS